jgi:hypothetical protein
MEIASVLCHVLQGNVARVVDLEGRVSQVICPEYDEMTGDCRLLKTTAGGPLSQLVERASEGRLGSASSRCRLH